MINIERIAIDHIPVLNVVKATLSEKRLPTVIYYHGFNGEKDSSLTIAYKIAEKGIRVLLPDAPLHGERSVSEDPVEHGFTFWEIILQMIEEVSLIRDYADEHQLAVIDNIGFGGTSMGGMVAYSCLKKYDWIATAAVLMGTPYLSKRAAETIDPRLRTGKDLLTKIDELDLSKQPEALKGRPLFIWHGEKDEIVPASDSRAFYKTIEGRYSDKNKLLFIEEKDRIHNISKLSIKKTAEWFEMQLL